MIEQPLLESGLPSAPSSYAFIATPIPNSPNNATAANNMTAANKRGSVPLPVTRLLDIILQDCGCDLERGGQRRHRHDCELFWGLVFVGLYTVITVLVVAVCLSVSSGSE